MAETALVVLFPELEPLVGDQRRRYTKGGAHDMPPHVTLVYPFADSSEVDLRILPISRAAGRLAPFEVAFRETARFAETLYLAPAPAEPFVELTAALGRAFPEFPPYGGAFDKVVPHLTVAHGADALLKQLEAELAPQLPLRTRVERAWLMVDTADGWRRHTAFPLDRHTTV
jgi:2'-5' RNA ligase